MPFQRPALSDLRKEVAADISAALPGADALLRYSNLGIMGDVQAGLAHLHYGYLDWISQQSVPWSATDEYLAAWASMRKVYRKAAQAWVGTASWNGAATKDLSAGVTVSRGDGVMYTTTSSGTVGANGIVTVSIQCNDPGAAGTCAPGTVLTLGQSISGISSNGSAASTTTVGVDVESVDDFRARMLAAYQSQPQGGAQDDYVSWAMAVPGVTRAWEAPNGFGPGTVVLYTMFDNAEATYNGFPQGTNGVSQNDPGPGGVPRGVVATGDQLTVANALVTQQPVTSLLYSCAPLANTVNFVMSGLSSSSASVRSAIAAAISDVFFRNGAPGGTLVNGKTAQPVDLSDINSAIAAVSGTEGFVITSPTGNISSATGYLPVLGTVTYV